MAATMRAKMQVFEVTEYPQNQRLILRAVGPKGNYPEDGSDENNTFARFTPCAALDMTITNPALAGKFREGQEFYVDFTEVEPASA